MIRYELLIQSDDRGRWITRITELKHDPAHDLWRQESVLYTDRCETWREALDLARATIEGFRNARKATTDETSAGTKE